MSFNIVCKYKASFNIKYVNYDYEKVEKLLQCKFVID